MQSRIRNPKGQWMSDDLDPISPLHPQHPHASLTGLLRLCNCPWVIHGAQGLEKLKNLRAQNGLGRSGLDKTMARALGSCSTIYQIMPSSH